MVEATKHACSFNDYQTDKVWQAGESPILVYDFMCVYQVHEHSEHLYLLTNHTAQNRCVYAGHLPVFSETIFLLGKFSYGKSPLLIGNWLVVSNRTLIFHNRRKFRSWFSLKPIHWWFQTWISFSISYMGCHPSHWRSPSFFKMVKLHHEPGKLSISMGHLHHSSNYQRLFVA